MVSRTWSGVKDALPFGFLVITTVRTVWKRTLKRYHFILISVMIDVVRIRLTFTGSSIIRLIATPPQKKPNVGWQFLNLIWASGILQIQYLMHIATLCLIFKQIWRNSTKDNVMKQLCDFHRSISLRLTPPLRAAELKCTIFYQLRGEGSNEMLFRCCKSHK